MPIRIVLLLATLLAAHATAPMPAIAQANGEPSVVSEANSTGTSIPAEAPQESAESANLPEQTPPDQNPPEQATRATKSFDSVVMTYAGVAFGIGLLLTLAFTPFCKRFATKILLVDHPDQKRKLHTTPIPLIGGIVIFLATIAAVVITQSSFTISTDGFLNGWYQVTGLLLASALILLIGLIDDRFGMRGRQKLLGQFAAATILVGFGYSFEKVGIFGTELELKVFSLLAVYAWILIGINSVNLLDGADGFASTIGFLMSAALCVMALHMGRGIDAVILAAAAGAVLGFLKYNFPPATAYLGDAGSMLIGLFVAAMSIRCASKEATAYAFIAPLALLAIPMFDTVAAIVRRRLTGRSIYTVDRGHLHHALIRKGYGPRKALLMFFAMCLMTAVGGILSLVYQQSEYALISVISVVVFLAVGKVFGIAEFQLIANRSRTLMRSFVNLPAKRPNEQSHQDSVRLQGNKNWDSCWQILREFAMAENVQHLTMDLNLPWLHESYHAKFQQRDRKNLVADEIWTAELPLTVDGRVIGRLDFSGCINNSSFFQVSHDLKDVLAKMEPHFRVTIASVGPAHHNDEDDYQAIRSAEFGETVTDQADEQKLDVG